MDLPLPQLLLIRQPLDKSDYIKLAKAAAAVHELDPKLVCAVVEQESGWDPWAIRYEPAFFEHYVKPHIPDAESSTEARAEAFSWGLMQVMGLVARGVGHHAHMASLCDPAVGLEIGCRVLTNKIQLAAGDITKALLYWNGGGNPDYPSQVLARMSKY